MAAAPVAIPTGTVYDAVDKPVDFPSIFKGKKVVLTGLPGAFTPTCSATHLPSYIKKHEEIKGKGVDEIVCLTVNDPFVAVAWSESTGATGKVRIVADPTGEVTKAMGLDFSAPVLGGVRCKRFSAVVEDGVIKHLHVEQSPGATECSLADPILKLL